MGVKEIAKHLAWPLGVVAAYHFGILNIIPGFDGPKKNGSPIAGK